jgi:hypothetical protein
VYLPVEALPFLVCWFILFQLKAFSHNSFARFLGSKWWSVISPQCFGGAFAKQSPYWSVHPFTYVEQLPFLVCWFILFQLKAFFLTISLHAFQEANGQVSSLHKASEVRLQSNLCTEMSILSLMLSSRLSWFAGSCCSSLEPFFSQFLRTLFRKQMVKSRLSTNLWRCVCKAIFVLKCPSFHLC